MLPPNVVRGPMNFKFTITWPALTGDDTGGSKILGYNIQYSAGLNSWEEVVGLKARFEETAYEQIFESGTPETLYYRIRAKNRWGWGPFSD